MKKFNTQNIDESPYYDEVINSYRRAIEILQNASLVQQYLDVISWQEHEEILLLRLHIDWFDCAISMLQEEEIFYLEETKQKATYYLNRYYRPKIETDLTVDKNWRWLMQQNDYITTSFFRTYSTGIVSLYPVKQATATSLYQMGSSYAEVLLPIPVSKAEIEVSVPLILSIAFRWTDEKMWGEINIRVNSEKILSKNQRYFLTLFRVDLINSNSRIEENLIVNAYGKFFVSNDDNKITTIKEFLNSKNLHCTLKLHA
ncbi:hypothetical protein [Candidatus Uabimicrobium sp. HlEnr_7]|uniref:hypothetical protein n=1 Tax=Candidatus Uabimicrobium helgolandensis TaxID=3095367 RepID=UPI0035574F74